MRATPPRSISRLYATASIRPASASNHDQALGVQSGDLGWRSPQCRRMSGQGSAPEDCQTAARGGYDAVSSTAAAASVSLNPVPFPSLRRRPAFRYSKQRPGAMSIRAPHLTHSAHIRSRGQPAALGGRRRLRDLAQALTPPSVAGARWPGPQAFPVPRVECALPACTSLRDKSSGAATARRQPLTSRATAIARVTAWQRARKHRTALRLGSAST